MKKSILLSMPQIKRRYHGEWVLIADPIYDNEDKIKKGGVLLHSQDREKIDKAMLAIKEKKIAIRYVGTIAKDLSVIL